MEFVWGQTTTKDGQEKSSIFFFGANTMIHKMACKVNAHFLWDKLNRGGMKNTMIRRGPQLLFFLSRIS
jgi:hypothetical protein